MKRYEIYNSELVLKNFDELDLDDHQVKLKIKACSLNYRDLMILENRYKAPNNDGLVPLSDAVGEIIEIGKLVKDLKVGDRVCPIFMQDWQAGKIRPEYASSALGGAINGVLSETLIVNHKSVVKIPDYLNNLEAATLPCAAVTAWNALVTYGKLKSEETILLIGTGGVSIFALQFAKILNARIILLTGKEQPEILKTYPVDHLINRNTTPDWGRVAGEIGADLVVEVGGGETINQSIEACKLAARISMVGILSGMKAEMNLPSIYRKMLTLQGIFVGSAENFNSMISFLTEHEIHPIISKVFPFSEAPAAYDYLKSGKHLGKIVIEF